eukprot:TRINITY_DN290_c0_g1_i2.p1 TRINITY_DN290_c0_g1~~TRINITY_DN290_c0_g1_i2.p1  ORF type:complete len:993 (+),score=397.05 TRINITY_DN290_c0_g1_i2:12684-15662(+)
MARAGLHQPGHRLDAAAGILDGLADGTCQRHCAGGIAMHQDLLDRHGQCLAVDGADAALAQQLDHALQHGILVFDHRALELARHQRALVVIGTVGQEGGSATQPVTQRGTLDGGMGGDTDDELAIEFGDGLDQRLGQGIVGGGHVAQRTVEAHVGDLATGGACQAFQRAQLVHHVAGQLDGVGLDHAATEAQHVGEADMGADIDAACGGQADGAVHDHRIAGVEAAGDVGRGDDVHERFIVAHLVVAESFADIGIEVDLHRDVLVVACAQAESARMSKSGVPQPTRVSSGTRRVAAPAAGLTTGRYSSSTRISPSTWPAITCSPSAASALLRTGWRLLKQPKPAAVACTGAGAGAVVASGAAAMAASAVGSPPSSRRRPSGPRSSSLPSPPCSARRISSRTCSISMLCLSVVPDLALQLHGLLQLDEVAFLLFQGRRGLGMVDLHEAQRLADAGLPQAPQVGFDHGPDLGIAARGLGIAQLDDGLAAVRHLDHARHDAVRTQLHAARGLQAWPFQAIAVAVALRRHPPGLAPELRQRLGGVTVIFGRRQDPHGNHLFLAGRQRQAQLRGTHAEAAGRDGRDRRSTLGARDDGQGIALLQWTSFEAAEAAAQLRAARTQHGWHIQPATHGQVGARTGAWHAQGQHLATTRMQAPPWRHRLAVECGHAVGTGQCKIGIGVEAQAKRQDRHFDAGRIAVIAQQDIAHGQRDIVHRARGAHAEAQHAEAAQVLHGAQCAGGKDFYHLMTFAMQKRMVSPGASRAGGSRRGSKNSISAWPMVFQPLGPAEADTPVCSPPMETAPPGRRTTGTLRRGVAMRGSMPPRQQQPGWLPRAQTVQSGAACRFTISSTPRPVWLTTSARCGPPSPPQTTGKSIWRPSMGRPAHSSQAWRKASCRRSRSAGGVWKVSIRLLMPGTVSATPGQRSKRCASSQMRRWCGRSMAPGASNRMALAPSRLMRMACGVPCGAGRSAIFFKLVCRFTMRSVAPASVPGDGC